jgi:hypothetical protein
LSFTYDSATVTPAVLPPVPWLTGGKTAGATVLTKAGSKNISFDRLRIHSELLIWHSESFPDMLGFSS